jgi:predicted ATPase/class 3 adenylate cyclase
MATTPATALSLPSGSVTFLFTDIEGSTSLWEQFPDDMRAALTRHDLLLERAIESFAGHIVKNTGDGVYAVFATAAKAVAASVSAQRDLQRLSRDDTVFDVAKPALSSTPLLKVRMGLHTGAAELRSGDYVGPTVNRAARIMSVAHGGQILVSAATADSLAGQLPEDTTLRDVGEHRLKGLQSPERLLQIVAPQMRADFPPLASLTGNSLPAERDAFVGRSESLRDLTRRLQAGVRLVSVIGMGGIGKTRLVMQFGRHSLGDYPGGVWFCDLTQARTLDGVTYAAAQGLDIPLGKEDPVAQIGNAIAGRGRSLVIFDNFEQVARHSVDTLGRWLDRAPEARFIVTTREVLGIRGEELLVLPPLSTADAAALFMRRAETARPRFEPSDEDQVAIATLMGLLEGLPLAIELAAARLQVMSPKILLARMSERFKLLASTGVRVDRQATLRAVFDWSWELLSAAEKAVLAQLSVFEGGFTLASMEGVIDLSAVEEASYVLDLLHSLVQKSFVRKLGDDRFDLLVSVQEYAAAHLRAPRSFPGSGPQAALESEVRHGKWFANLTDEAATANACAELDNLVVACRRAIAREDAAIAARTLDGAWAGLASRGPFRIGAELASLVRAVPGLRGAAAANVFRIYGHALEITGRYAEAYEQSETSLALARNTRDLLCECQSLARLAFLDLNMSRTGSAGIRFEALLVAASQAKLLKLQSDAHNGLGSLSQALGRMDAARVHFEAALTNARDARDKHREASIVGNLGTLYTDWGRMDEARSHQESALSLAREIGNRKFESHLLCNLGLLHFVQGALGEARESLEGALALGRDLGNARLECIVMCNLGMVYDGLSQFDEGRGHFESALVLARELGDPGLEGQCLCYLGRLHAHLGDFSEARKYLDRSEPLLYAASDQLSLAILHCARAETEHLAGDPDAARSALKAAESIAEARGSGAASELGVGIARVHAMFRISAT